MNILFEMLEEKLTPSEVVELLSSFEKDDLCDYAERNLICTRCYSDLIIHKWKESRGEMGNRLVYEEMVEYYCEGCGGVE